MKKDRCSMKKIFIVFVVIFLASSAAIAKNEIKSRADIPLSFTLQDRDNIKNLETKIDQGFEKVKHQFDAVQKQFDAVNQRFDSIEKRMEDSNKSLNQRIDDLSQRINNFEDQMRYQYEDLKSFMKWGFGILFSMFSLGMTALVGFILWDRRTFVKPLEEKQKDYDKYLSEHENNVADNKRHITKIERENKIMKEMLVRLSPLKPDTLELAKELGQL